MPLYEYRCKECGARFEAMRRISQRHEAPKCAECGSEETELTVSAPAFFGGGGGGASGGSCAPSGFG